MYPSGIQMLVTHGVPSVWPKYAPIRRAARQCSIQNCRRPASALASVKPSPASGCEKQDGLKSRPWPLALAHSAQEAKDMGFWALNVDTFGISLVLGALLVRLCVPLTGTWWRDWPLFLAGLLALALAVGVVESAMARLKLRRVPQLLVAAILSCAFGFLMLMLPVMR